MGMSVLSACMFMHHVDVSCLLQRPEEGVGFPGTELADSYESPHGYWKLNQVL